MPEAKGPRSLKTSVMNGYLAKLHRAAHYDPVAAEAFLRVANLLVPPPTLLHPKIMMRVLKGNLLSTKPPHFANGSLPAEPQGEKQTGGGERDGAWFP